MPSSVSYKMAFFFHWKRLSSRGSSFPVLINLYVDIIGLMIRWNNNIKGIKIEKDMTKIWQISFSVKSTHNLKNCAKSFHDHLNPRLGSIQLCLNLVYTPHVGGIPGVFDLAFNMKCKYYMVSVSQFRYQNVSHTWILFLTSKVKVCNQRDFLHDVVQQ